MNEIERLQQKLRGMRWLAFWALLFGLGIGFYAGFTLGVNTARDAAKLTAPQAN